MVEAGHEHEKPHSLDSEQWLRDASAVAPIAILAIDRYGIIRAANPQAYAMFGYAVGEPSGGLIDRPVDDLLPSRLRDLHAVHRTSYLGSPRIRAIGRGQEFRALRKDGTEFNVEIGLNPIEGNAAGMIACTILDVSTRVAAEETLHQQRVRQPMIVDHIAEGIVNVDEAGVVNAFNRAAERIFGHRAYAVIGRPVTMLMAEPHRRLSARSLKRLIATRIKPLLNSKIEVIGQRADGSTVSLELTLSGAEVDSGALMTGIVTDVTEKRQQAVAVTAMQLEKARVETALQETEGTFRDLIDRANVVPYAWDIRQQRFLSVGPRARALLGYDESEWLSLGFWERVTFAEDWSSVYQATDPHALLLGEHETQYRMAHSDGRTVWVRDVLANEQIEQDQHIIRGFLFDVTETRQRDLQLAQALKMDAVGQLTGGIAHDFNNLLAVIVGNLDMLAESANLPAREKEQVELSLSAALRGAELTRQMLAFSQQQDMRAQQLDLAEVVKRMVRLLTRTLGSHYEIRHAHAAALWEVRLDPGQFETAMLNLALNARDAMPSGGAIVISTENTVLGEDYCQTNPDARPGEFVCVSVSDTGAGIAPEIVGRVFDPYFTTKTVGQGSGLGLSMVYGFVKQSGGHVRIYSEVGHGTTLRLYLPRAFSEQDTELTSPTPIADPHGQGELILVVEDDVQVRKMVSQQLEDLGYRVLLAETGPRALDLMRENNEIAAVLTDVIMPGGMFGADLGLALRALRPDIPILFTSGFTGTGEQLSRVLALGPFLNKPFRKAELALSMRALLAG